MGIGFEERLRSLNTPGMVAKGVPRPALKKMIAAPPRPAKYHYCQAPPRPARGSGQTAGRLRGKMKTLKL